MSTESCECANCPNAADYIIYPDHRRKREVAVVLCAIHRDVAYETVDARTQLYFAASQLVRNSLNG